MELSPVVVLRVWFLEQQHRHHQIILEMQIIGPHPGPSESENVGMELKQKSSLCFNKLPW